MLITLKLDCFHRKLSSYNYRTFFPLKVVLFLLIIILFVLNFQL